MHGRRRLPLGAMVAATLVVGLGAYAFVSPDPPPTPSSKSAPTDGASPTAYASNATAEAAPDQASTPLSPPAADGAVPTPYPAAPVYAASHGPFHEGAWVRVNAGAGDCLNARVSPKVDGAAEVVNLCLPDGTEGYLSGSAVQADGLWWWQFAGAGYVAEDYLTYVRDADLRQALASQLAGLGRIAFLRDPGEVWLMGSDGGRQRLLYSLAGSEASTYMTDLSWSPDATRLSFNVPHYQSADGGTMELVVIDTDGRVIADVPGVAGRGWSPDGKRIGIVQGAQPQQMGGGWKGVPGWVDVATAEVHLIGTDAYWQQDPPAFNFDGSLLLVTRSAADGSSSAIVVMDTAGNERARIDMPQDVYYGSPVWAPESNRIAFHVSEQNAPHHSVYDVGLGTIVARMDLPARNPNLGGGCGSGDMYRSEWSRDGRSLLYGYAQGLSGANGIWSWDVAKGERRLIPSSYAGVPSPGPNGLVAFTSGLFIFAGTPDDGVASLITDGRSPVWAPR